MNDDIKPKPRGKRWKRILKWTSGAILVALIAWTFITYWTSTNDCERYAAAPTNPMKAVVYCDYDVHNLKFQDSEKPTPADDQLLVKVRAASVNPLDWHFIEGTPYIMRAMGVGMRKPKDTRLGVDFAGTVEAVGKNVTKFKPGDEVFGGRTGAFAEYVCVREARAVALKPARVTFEQAASVPIAGITALQGVRDKGKIQRGQKVLINGASGGVGTFAVQIAKSMGADVTGVCSTRNLDMVRSLGADHVIDYTQEDFTQSGQKYDLILQLAGTRSPSDCRRALTPKGTLLLSSGESSGRWIGPIGRIIKALVLSPIVSQRLAPFEAKRSREDLQILKELIEAGKVTPVIDRTYSLSEVPEAIRYLEEGHARGKIVITM